MKYIALTFIVSLLSISGFSQKKELRAYLDSKQFYAPGVGNYVEFHLQFVGYSLNYIGKDGGLIGEVAVQMNIEKKDSIITSDAYRLTSPLMKDSIVDDFFDIKRFVLEPGDYTFNLSLSDMNSDLPPLEASQLIIIEDLSDAISISDIEVAEYGSRGDGTSPFYKSGYDIIPRLSTFYPKELNTIPVYFEVYNSLELKDSIFGIKQTVVDANLNKEIEEFTVYTRHFAADVVPVLKTVKIDDLLTGKYILNYTIVNKNMRELSTQSYEFERSNDKEIDYFSDEIILDPAFQESIPPDSLGYFLESLIPISGANETRNIYTIAKAKSSEKARKYIQQYWTKTSPETPYESWIQYKKQVALVERLYANNFQEGFETDRGRVYLQYGSPTNIINKEYSPTEYPYEIWQYNKIGAFSNKRFVFYNPDLTNKAYRLLHSDMIGELKNPSWPRELARRNSGNGNVDNPNAGTQDHWGGQSNDLFRQY